MIETLTAWAINYGLITAASGIAAFIVGWILKKIPTDKWAKTFREIGRKQGRAISVCATGKLKTLWSGVIEPVFIDTLDALFFAWWSGFVDGLKSDN